MGFTFPIAAVIILAGGVGTSARAQSFNLEGQTGGMATPFAYVIASKAESVGAPAIAFHLLSGGEAVGTRYQISATTGFLGRLEVGYTKAAVSHGTETEAGSIFDRGFMMVHAKALLVPENMNGSNAPAISAGFIYRFQGSVLEGTPGGPVRNGDIYVAATKTFSQINQAPIVISGGVKGTNATPFSFAGNSTGWSACGFVFGGVKLGGRVLIGAEYAQQPKSVDGVPEASMPATWTILMRAVPDKKGKLSLELALVSLGDHIGEGLDINANYRPTFGVGYRF
jgi:hypothetical protein